MVVAQAPMNNNRVVRSYSEIYSVRCLFCAHALCVRSPDLYLYLHHDVMMSSDFIIRRFRLVSCRMPRWFCIGLKVTPAGNWNTVLSRYYRLSSNINCVTSVARLTSKSMRPKLLAMLFLNNRPGRGGLTFRREDKCRHICM